VSVTYRLWRERWAARRMIVTRWIAQPRERVAYGGPICELEVDGRSVLVSNTDDEQLSWGMYWTYVDEGREVEPDARLFEYSYDGFLPAAGALANMVPRGRSLPYRRRDTYPEVFFSYRRSDSDAYAGRLHEFMAAALGGPDHVFMDLFSIRPGEPFPWAVQQAVAHCAVMLVLIGPRWLDAAAADGKRRLDDEFDFVRREIAAALDRRVTLIPLLLPGAASPDTTRLPPDLRGLEELQMLSLSARHWTDDANELLAIVRDVVRESSATRTGPGSRGTGGPSPAE
jgi:hypothetical protein